MSGTTREDIRGEYICGKCLQPIFYLLSDGPPDTCNECGYAHKARPVTDVPSETKVDLNQL